MNSVLDNLELWVNERHFVDDIIVLHSKVAQAIPSIIDQSDPQKSFNKLTIKKLQDRCSEISWLSLINGVLKNSNKSLKENDIISVISLTYIDKICAILKEYKSNVNKTRILLKDLEWAAISSVITFGSEKLLELNNKLSQDIFGVIGKKDLWKTCLKIVSGTLLDIMGNMYIKEKFHSSQKKDIELMIQNIQKSLKSVLENITWMDAKTKKEALKKLSSIRIKIGYPDYLLVDSILRKDNENVTMDPENYMENYIEYQKFYFAKELKKLGQKTPDDFWIVGVHGVNAFYNPIANEIVFPAAILRYPYYDIGLPISLNYGGIGAAIGHEILHAFDTEGSKFDENGRLRDWWTKASKDEYSKKTDCIRQQYKEYSIYNISLNSNQTIGEDIADNAGLRMSYMALFSTDKKMEQLTLPGLDFTPEQLFFVNHAKIWCSIFTKAVLVEFIQNDVHSVWKYRIIGAQSNMPEFSKAFKCDTTKKMNRLNKCVVW